MFSLIKESFVFDESRGTLTVPKKYRATVIGSGGNTIREFQKFTCTRIRIKLAIE